MYTQTYFYVYIYMCIDIRTHTHTHTFYLLSGMWLQAPSFGRICKRYSVEK